MFDYHMKLHYSQTIIRSGITADLFDYHMKLHYSQTQFENKRHYYARITYGSFFIFHINLYLL